MNDKCPICQTPVNGCSDDISFCSEACANIFLDKMPKPLIIDGECECDDCLMYALGDSIPSMN